MCTRIPTNSFVYKIINVNHKIVVLCADCDDLIANIWIYDLLSSTWKQGAEFPNPRAEAGFAFCASPEGSIYMAGGNAKYDDDPELRDAAVYKVDEDKWELLPQMPQEIGRCKGFFIEGMFYVIGTSNNRCQRFDPNTRIWTTLINMSLPDSWSDILYAFGRLIAFGRNGIEQYEWEGNVWRQLEPIPGKLKRVLATVWCDQIFLLAYENTSHMRPFVYIYKPGAAFSERWISVDQLNFFLDSMTVRSIATIEI
ncbi:hypothetical protein SUGI_0702260 [Cryptomeria japonica]|nr:hypothetical protein SUGI_0702260 [Cryptomeria japonica]